MAGDPGDLQAWLNTLKQKAQESGGGDSAPQQPPAARAKPRSSRPQNTDKVRGEYTRSYGASRSGHRADERKDEIPHQHHDLRRAETIRHEENADRRREEERAEKQQRREANLREKKERDRQKKLRKIREAKKKEAAEKERKKYQHIPQAATPRSTLGLSGNLIHDLRNNPRALREAILLHEILGKPVADRNPFDSSR